VKNIIKELDIPGTVKRIRRRSVRENLLRLLGMKESASKIALSIAIGMLVGIAVPMGLETIVAVSLSLLFRCNPLLATITTWITNPVTIIPLYYFAYRLAGFLLHQSIQWSNIEAVIANPTLGKIYQIGFNGFGLIFFGCLVLGIISSILSYITVYHLINYYRKKHGIQTQN
jgi:uncharacterized protein